ncbi:MAG TPA: 4-hydroxy-tetrahydrodipicolinate synthase [Fimbriimonadaceae bacterium]|jgi:4-hydroxy-tetrahydrodipicolinate synthase
MAHNYDMFKGCGTALVTPFRSDESLDEVTFRELIRRQIEEGIDFIVPCGTTGESPTLDHDEHLRVVQIAIQEAKGKVPVLAGAGGYNTTHVIKMAREVEGLGADGILSVTPYYNKPTQEGVYQHFKAIAESIQIPVVLYSVQPRTNVNIDPVTVERLSQIPNIVGIKEASGNLSQVASIANRVSKDFLIFSGDDAVTLPVISLGGQGLISVASNEIPGPMSQLTNKALKGDYEGARAIQATFQPLLEVNFIESNPGPAKLAMEMMGLLEANYRLPILRPNPESEKKIREVLLQCGLLEQRSLTGVR